MSLDEYHLESIPSLQDSQNLWALDLLAYQAKILTILAEEDLLDRNAKEIPSLGKDHYKDFDVTDWNKYRKINHISFSDLIDLTMKIKKRPEREKSLHIIQKIHSLRLNLINSFIPLIHFIARKYAKHNQSLFADLTSEGYVGLLKCLDSFYYVDPHSSIKSYVIFYIKQEMRRYLLENQKGYRIPYIASIKKKQEENPQDLTISGVQYFSDLSGDFSSPYENNIPSSIKAPPEDIWDSSLKQILDQVLSTLPKNERTVLVLRYGLSEKQGDKKLSLRQIGETLSLSKERIRQIEKKALEHLYSIVRGLLREDDLDEED